MPDEYCIQDKLLTSLREHKSQVAIYLVNGIKLQGTITNFDKFTINLEPNCQLILKHTIATILPLTVNHWETDIITA